VKGLVLRQENETIAKQAKQHGLAVTVGEPSIAYERTLIVGAGVNVPWSLLDAAWGWLDKWDCAAPLWRYGVLAQDVGGLSERERTEAITRDLRIPLYATELLFVRRSETTEQLLAVWQAERDGGDERLAFLRALYEVKPLFLALPRSWLAKRAAPVAQPRRNTGSNVRLVHVQIAPGRSVCCRPDEVEIYRQRYAQLAQRRGRC